MDNLLFYDSKLHREGLTIYVEDLFSRNNTLLEKFNFYLFTTYYGILSAIPKGWTSFIFSANFVSDNHDYSIKFWTPKLNISQLIYPFPPVGFPHWDLSQEDWHCIFRTAHFTVTETKIQYFQLRILHRILGTSRLSSYFLVNSLFLLWSQLF